MTAENKDCDTLLVQTQLTGSITDIQEGSASSDGNWLTAPANVTTVCSVGFPTPTDNLTSGAGLQTFNLRCRDNSTSSREGTYVVDVYEAGSLFIASIASGTSADNNAEFLIAGTWDASGLSDVSGVDVECRVTGTPAAAGPGSQRGTLEIGAIDWDVNYTVPGSFQSAWAINSNTVI